jgi:HEPN domain-containing protein
MRNLGLAADYVWRAGVRLKALNVLFDAKSWADVVRESQAIVELALKGLLRHLAVEAPRIHDVSDVLLEHRDRLPRPLQDEVERIAAMSRELRRDRELAFYGAEDLTPSDFYSESDAVRARDGASLVVGLVGPVVLTKGRRG